MIILPFQEHHLKDLHYMHLTQKSDSQHIKSDILPQIGLIVYGDCKPMCAGFVRFLEPCFGQIDSLVSNADLSSETRHKALDYLVNRLIHASKEKGLKGLVCHTKDEGILKRAESIGFHVVNEKIIAKML